MIDIGRRVLPLLSEGRRSCMGRLGFDVGHGTHLFFSIAI
jgi:hypothetical protein